jgi:hypothetical protein
LYPVGKVNPGGNPSKRATGRKEQLAAKAGQAPACFAVGRSAEGRLLWMVSMEQLLQYLQSIPTGAVTDAG